VNAVLVSEAAERYVSDRHRRGEIGARSADQLRWRLTQLARTCPDLPVARLDRDHLRAWQVTVGAQRPASRRAYLSTVRVFVAWCVDEGLLTGDPTRALGRVREPRRSPRALSAGQMARLSLVLPDAEARLIVALMGRQGLRCVEVSRLAAEDYDPARRDITVDGKAANRRTIAVADDVAERLDAWLAGRTSGPVVNRSAHWLSKQVSAWMAAAGIKTGSYDGRSAHALRHTAASNLYDNTRDARAVQDFLGHANLATTDRYLRRGSDAVIRAGLNHSTTA
jgi:integrase/recombinase XerC